MIDDDVLELVSNYAIDAFLKSQECRNSCDEEFHTGRTVAAHYLLRTLTQLYHDRRADGRTPDRSP